MRRKRSRGTGYLGTDKGLRELYPRLGLDNAARAQSTDPHNRRKPGLLSTGTPELADSAVTNAKISDVNASKVDAGTLADARIPQLAKGKIQAAGQWAKSDLPNDTNFGKRNSETDIDWKNKSIPDAALNKEYAPADTVAALRQSVTGMGNKVQNLNQRVNKLERGKK